MTNEHGHAKMYTFFVDNKPYKTTKSTPTGAEIKAMVPDFDPNYSLFLETPGPDPDKLIQDPDTVSLDSGKNPVELYLKRIPRIAI